MSRTVTLDVFKFYTEDLELLGIFRRTVTLDVFKFYNFFIIVALNQVEL